MGLFDFFKLIYVVLVRERSALATLIVTWHEILYVLVCERSALITRTINMQSFISYQRKMTSLHCYVC